MTTPASTHAPTLRALFGPGAVESSIFAMSLLTGPVVSRALGDEGRGSLAAVLVPTQLVGWMLLLGVPYGSAMLVRRFDNEALISGAWRVAATIAGPVSVGCYFLAPLLLADHPATTITWFRIGLIGTVLSIPVMTAIHLRLIIRGGNWRYSLAKNVNLVGYSVAVVGLAIAGRLTLSTALASWLVSYLASRVVLLGVFDAWPRRWATAAMTRAQLSTGRAQAVITMATVSLGRIDQVFLAFLATSAELGTYAVAATAAQVSLPVAKGFADVVLPDAFARPEGDISGRAAFLVFVISAATGAASAVLAPWLIPAVFGAPFSASVRLLWLLIPGQVFFNTAWVISARHLGTGRPGVAATAISIAAGVNLVAIAPAVAVFGPEGAAALTSVCQAIFLAIVWVRRAELALPQSAAE